MITKRKTAEDHYRGGREAREAGDEPAAARIYRVPWFAGYIGVHPDTAYRMIGTAITKTPLGPRGGSTGILGRHIREYLGMKRAESDIPGPLQVTDKGNRVASETGKEKVTLPSVGNIDGLRRINLNGFSGIYFLCRDGEVIYVGQTVNIYARLSSHTVKPDEYDDVLLLPVPARFLDDVEGAWIRYLKPRRNTNFGTGTPPADDEILSWFMDEANGK